MKARIEKVSTGTAASFLCRRRRDERFGFAWHFHPELELTWIVRSRGRRFVGDSIEPYDAGDLVLLGPNLPHTWESDPTLRGTQEALFCQFPRDFLGRGFLDAPELSPVRRLLDRASQGLRFSGRAAREAQRRMEALEGRTGAGRIAGLIETLDLLARTRDARPLSSRDFGPALRRGDGERIDRVCRFLSERCRGRVTRSEAAAAAHLSVPAFGRFFRRKTGKTLVAWLNELRIGMVCRELIDGERPISDIAFDCGFNNLSNFNRRFLELHRESPGSFRRRYRST